MEYRRSINPVSQSNSQPERVELSVSEPAGKKGTHSRIHSQLVMYLADEEPEKLRQIKPDPSGENRVEHINAALDALNRGVYHNDQQSLFNYRPAKPAEYVLDYLSGSRIGRIHSMNLLGMAKNIADAHNTPISPSHDLSRHSTALIEGLGERGIIKPGSTPPMTTNTMDFDDNYIVKTENMNTLYPEVVPEEDVAAGRQTMRNIIKSNRKPRPTVLNQDQLQLDL